MNIFYNIFENFVKQGWNQEDQYTCYLKSEQRILSFSNIIKSRNKTVHKIIKIHKKWEKMLYVYITDQWYCTWQTIV